MSLSIPQGDVCSTPGIPGYKPLENTSPYSQSVVLNRGGVRGHESLHALQNRKILNGNVSLLNITPVLILRRYVLFGLVPAEMEVGVKYLEILQAEFESACKHSGAQLGGLISRHAKSL